MHGSDFACKSIAGGLHKNGDFASSERPQRRSVARQRHVPPGTCFGEVRLLNTVAQVDQPNGDVFSQWVNFQTRLRQVQGPTNRFFNLETQVCAGKAEPSAHVAEFNVHSRLCPRIGRNRHIKAEFRAFVHAQYGRCAGAYCPHAAVVAHSSQGHGGVEGE